MAIEMNLDYYPEQDILYLRSIPLPQYRVREPIPDFLIYVSAEGGEIVGFEILDFSSVEDIFEERHLEEYLNFRIDIKELGLKDTPLRKALKLANQQLVTKHRSRSRAPTAT